jgi:hypothetical protein
MANPRFTELKVLKAEIAADQNSHRGAIEDLATTVVEAWADQIDAAIEGEVPEGTAFPRGSSTADYLRTIVKKIIHSALKDTDHFSEM